MLEKLKLNASDLLEAKFHEETRKNLYATLQNEKTKETVNNIIATLHIKNNNAIEHYNIYESNEPAIDLQKRYTNDLVAENDTEIKYYAEVNVDSYLEDFFYHIVNATKMHLKNHLKKKESFYLTYIKNLNEPFFFNKQELVISVKTNKKIMINHMVQTTNTVCILNTSNKINFRVGMAAK